MDVTQVDQSEVMIGCGLNGITRCGLKGISGYHRVRATNVI